MEEGRERQEGDDADAHVDVEQGHPLGRQRHAGRSRQIVGGDGKGDLGAEQGEHVCEAQDLHEVQ